MTASVSERGYARPELLADTDWLASQLDSPGVRIIDARSANEYAAGHIPGAVHMDGFGRSIPRAQNDDMGSPEDFAHTAGGLGIANDTTVVVYDTPSQRMGMVAWTFLYYGHPDIRILDGGVAKWQMEGRALDEKAASWPSATYVAEPVPGVYCCLEDAKAGLTRDDFVFWDTRSDNEYSGDEAGFRAPPRPGHIPGAAHLDWNELLDPDSRTLKPAADLRKLLEARGITPDKQVASYCNGGARGALAGYVLQVLGYERGQAYAGSFAQWSNQADTPVER
ncbi:MAG TPA: rhodanese-like domain-containing protein [Dehalococcoidia bacterium]|jgi:thiosulfate/3-mercaptopyruvate sulfurtransferase